MGLIRAALGAAGGVLADQWKEFFYCDALPADVLAVKGKRRNSGRSSNTSGSDNIISSGSVIAVADGQAMMIVEQGKVVEFSAEPGEFVFDASTEPSIFNGNLGESIIETFKQIGKRFTFGGEAPKDQRVYYFNTKELMGNKYGTPSAIPFRVIDQRAGIDIEISLRCFGEFSYRIADPMLFYTNVCGNVSESYTRQQIDSQLKSDFLTSLQPAFGRISAMGVRYSEIPAHTRELADAINEELSSLWRRIRGLEVVTIGVNSVKASEEDEKMLKEMQRLAAYSNPGLAAARLADAQAEAMVSAAKNESTGPMMAFAGMNMAAGATGGMNVQGMYQMAQEQQNHVQPKQNYAQPQQPAQQPVQPVPQSPASTDNLVRTSAQTSGTPASESWTCPQCGAEGNTGKFCMECGGPKPLPVVKDTWTCASCGAENKGKFCMECGAKKPAGTPQYKCDKCGWEPADPTHPPKFCPECGDPFDDGDIQ